jgi:hypothetical protein
MSGSALRLVTGDERKVILDHRKSFASSYLRFVLINADTGRSRAFAFALPASGSDDDKFRRLRDAPDSPLVTLACARTLPAGTEMKLVWGKGIATSNDVATTDDQALAFEVRPAFRATFRCERVNRNAQCLSLIPLTLSFTAPVARRDAAQIRLVDTAVSRIPQSCRKGRTSTPSTQSRSALACRRRWHSGSKSPQASRTTPAACSPMQRVFRSRCRPMNCHRWPSLRAISASSKAGFPVARNRCCR